MRSLTRDQFGLFVVAAATVLMVWLGGMAFQLGLSSGWDIWIALQVGGFAVAGFGGLSVIRRLGRPKLSGSGS